jgi:hypothetical protein
LRFEGLGHIYIISNSNMPNLFKIGYTTRSVDERSKELSTPTGVPGKFEVVESWEVGGVAEMESTIHENLSEYRVDGEFFRFESASACIDRVVACLKEAGELDEDGLTIPETVRESERKKLEEDLDLGVAQFNEYRKKLRHIWQTDGEYVTGIVLTLAEAETGFSTSEIEKEIEQIEKVPDTFSKRVAHAFKERERNEILGKLKRNLREIEARAALCRSAVDTALEHQFWQKIRVAAVIKFSDLTAWYIHAAWEGGVLEVDASAAPSFGNSWWSSRVKKDKSGITPFPYEGRRGRAVKSASRSVISKIPKSMKLEAEEKAKEEFAKHYPFYVDCAPNSGGSVELQSAVEECKVRISRAIGALDMIRLGL